MDQLQIFQAVKAIWVINANDQGAKSSKNKRVNDYYQPGINATFQKESQLLQSLNGHLIDCYYNCSNKYIVSFTKLYK